MKEHKDALTSKVRSLIECYEGSRTEGNNIFVSGVIYGLQIAYEMIERELSEEQK